MITFRQGKLGLGMSFSHIRVQNGSEIYLFWIFFLILSVFFYGVLHV